MLGYLAPDLSESKRLRRYNKREKIIFPLFYYAARPGFPPQSLAVARSFVVAVSVRSSPGASSDVRYASACWPSAKLTSDLFESRNLAINKKSGHMCPDFLFCCETWIRTRINGFKGRCPTVRRSRNQLFDKRQSKFKISLQKDIIKKPRDCQIKLGRIYGRLIGWQIH